MSNLDACFRPPESLETLENAADPGSRYRALRAAKHAVRSGMWLVEQQRKDAACWT